jgi:putative SOS response-associated peptidase YedK
MCGRYSLAPGEFSEIQLEFQVERGPTASSPGIASPGIASPGAGHLGAGGPILQGPGVEPRYNIAPTWSPGHEPPIVLQNTSGERELALARWWLIPASWKRPLKTLPTAFNARAEELASKRFWSKSFDARRCLVPATGWREFTGPAGQRQPHHFHYGEHLLFAFAGIWDEWMSSEGDTVRSFAIVTVPASDAVARVHDRMPLFVSPRDYNLWLDPSTPGARALDGVRAAVAPELSSYEADPAGNDVRREGPGVIAPVRRKQLSLF